MAGKRKAASGGKKRLRAGEYVGFRSPLALKAKLAKAADNAGRSLSSEAQFRLERSFEREDLLHDVLDLSYGKPIAGLLMLLGTGMRNAALRQAHRTATDVLDPGHEILNSEAQREALLAARLIIEHFSSSEPTAEGGRSTLGEVVGYGLIHWLEQAPTSADNGQLIELRERLANLARRK